MAKMSWDDAGEKAKNVGGGTFVSLKNDKDKVVVAFVGDPDARETFWDNAKQVTVPYTPEHAKAGEKPSLKIKFNVAVFKEGNGENLTTLPTPVMKVLEVNGITFNAIFKARKKYGADKVLFEIERSGKPKDTKTTYSVLSDDAITPDMLKQIEALTPHNLESQDSEEDEFETYGKDGKKDEKAKSDKKSDKPAGEKAADKPKTPPVDDSPIEAEVAQQLVARLKPLDRLKITEFLTKFGIAKIKELKKKDYAEADAFVKSLEAPPAPETAPEEADPFAE